MPLRIPERIAVRGARPSLATRNNTRTGRSLHRLRKSVADSEKPAYAGSAVAAERRTAEQIMGHLRSELGRLGLTCRLASGYKGIPFD